MFRILRKSLAALIATLLFTSIVGSSSHLAHADAVVDWNKMSVDTIKAGGHPLMVQAVEIAIVHAAIYDAVQAFTGTLRPLPCHYPRCERLLPSPPSPRRATMSCSASSPPKLQR